MGITYQTWDTVVSCGELGRSGLGGKGVTCPIVKVGIADDRAEIEPPDGDGSKGVTRGNPTRSLEVGFEARMARKGW